MTTLKKRRTNNPPAVTVYVTPTCVNCPQTLHLLRQHGIQHTLVDITKDTTAYTYVTQDLGYKQAPIVVASDGKEQVSWSGHNLQLINEHILATHEPDPFDTVATMHE